ncbi:MAG: hypothetical protein KBS81_09665 [Spirochaetales bacterium]|nr:hypothetical protein [Candidatus Physcosoma equi]
MEFELHNIRKEDVAIRFYGDKGNRQYRVTRGSRNDSFVGKLSEEEWSIFAERLFSEVFIDKWKPNYFSSRIHDGSTWTVNVSFEKKHALSFHGCNCYPAYWNCLVDVLSPYCRRCDIEIPVAVN